MPADYIAVAPTGFVMQPVPSGNFIHRVFGRRPRAGAFVEIRNMLATRPWSDVRDSDVAAVLAKYRVLPREVNAELRGIFERAASYAAADRVLTEEEQRGIKRLREAFELTESEATENTENAARTVYRERLLAALTDGTFTDAERKSLADTAGSLQLRAEVVDRLHAEEAREVVQLYFDQAIADRRFSADEDTRLHEMATSLGISFNIDEKAAKMVERFRLFAQIEAGQLQSVQVPIILQRGEICHFSASVTQSEMRTITKRVNYSGPTASIKIMKGVRWRVGSVSVQRVTADVLTRLDAGTFYLTNKRVLLNGQRKNSSVLLKKIVHFTVYSDGLQIEKETGKDLYFQGAADWEIAGACLDYVARNAR